MDKIELKQFRGKQAEVVLMNYRMVLRETLLGVDKRYVKLTSVDELFVLVHGKRLSKLMLATSFFD